MERERSSAIDRLSEPSAARPKAMICAIDEVGVVAGPVGVDGLDRRRAGQGDVAGGDAEEDRREEGDDEVQQEPPG